jgi:prolyl oligopeptidase
VGWDGDGRGFLYSRYPAKGERPDADLDFYQQVYHHTLGTPVSKDPYVIGKDLPKIAEIKLDTSPDGRRQLIEVLNGDGGEHAYWLRQPDGRLIQVAAFKDQAVEGEMGSDALYLLSRHTSLYGSILRVPYETPNLAAARAVVPASEAGIHEFVVTEHRIYVHDIVGGPSQVRVFGTDGKALGTVALPAVTDVSGLAKGSGDDAWLELQSYTEPPHWMHVRGATGTLESTPLVMRSPADFSDIDAHREFAVSKDGTKVPMTILMRRGVQVDGKAPVLLYGYGGYQISEVPDFRPIRRLWLEQGGIWVIANIRGGGEFGDGWHRDGMLLKKQNDYDDFAACAKWLIDHHYTTPDRLACNGASNGGLLMGVMITQQPKTFRAVVSDVGVYDMLRSELSPNGLFNTTEYGTVRDSAQYRALAGYSPLHNVKNRVTYPSILLMTGINDPRVEPYNSFKFAAALQATGTSRPVLLRTSMSTGHIGVPLDARNEKYADMFSFLFDQLGVPYHPVTRPAP